MSEFNIDLQQILSFLVEGNLVPEDVLPKINEPFKCDELINRMEEGSDLEYDSINDVLYCVSDDGTKIVCPDLSEGLSEASEWICKYLPEVFIDTDQGGNLRKGDEADSCFKLFSIGFVLPDYRDEIKEIFIQYDYENMSSNDHPSSKSFKQALGFYQNLNSTRINSIISAAAYKLSSFKEKNESFYTGQLSQEEISELATLSRNIKAVISKYEREQGLNPDIMKGMTKISKLLLIDKRDIEIEALINKSKVSTLYRISKLTSERIPPVIKTKILRQADSAASAFIRENDLKGFAAADADVKIRRIVVKEGYRAVLKSIKAKEIELYKSNKDKYVFKRKS